jgi:hypothetical protein
MPLSALRYADGPFGESQHPLKLCIPLASLRQEVSPPSEEDAPLIGRPRAQICFRRTTSAMRHCRSVEPYCSPPVAFEVLWLSRSVRDVFLRHTDLMEPINSVAIMKAADVLMSLSLPAPSSPPHPSAHIRLTMLEMPLPVCSIFGGQHWTRRTNRVVGLDASSRRVHRDTLSKSVSCPAGRILTAQISPNLFECFQIMTALRRATSSS